MGAAAKPVDGSFAIVSFPRSQVRHLSRRLRAATYITAMAGSKFGRVGIETAFWDIEAKRQGKPLYQVLGGTSKPAESGLAWDCDDCKDLLRTIERYLKDGYKRVKIKIERGRYIELVRAVRETFGYIGVQDARRLWADDV